MTLRAVKIEARTPPQGRRIITRSRCLRTKPNGLVLSSCLPVSDAVGAMVNAPVFSSMPSPNPCLTLSQKVEAPYLCSDKMVKDTSSCSGKLSISFCGAVSVKSNQKMAQSPLAGRGIFTRTQVDKPFDSAQPSLKFVCSPMGVLAYSPEVCAASGSTFCMDQAKVSGRNVLGSKETSGDS